MRGRSLFKLFKYILQALSVVFKLLPRFVSEWFWVWADFLPGRFGVGFRYVLAKSLSKSLGDSVYFGRGVEIKGWENLVICNNVSIHKDCYIDASGGIVIGNDVSIAHGSSLLSFDHTWQDELVPIRSNPLLFNPIKINSDVWVGCGVRILSGVTVNNRSIIAAGSVVTKNVDAHCLVAGVPAKVIKKI